MINSFFYTFLLFFSFWGIGALIIKFIPIKYQSIFENSLFNIGLGYVVISNILFLMGLINFVNKTSVMTLFIIALIISFFILKIQLQTTTFNNNPFKNFTIVDIIISSLLLILVFMSFVGALAPPTLSDSMNHHLAAPKYFSELGGFPFIPIQPWPFPGLAHVLFTKVLLLSNPVSCQLIIFIFGILTTLVVFQITCKYEGCTAGLFASLIYYSLPLTTELNTGAMTEHASNFLLILSLWLILFGLNNKVKYKAYYFLFAGLLGGSAGATKVWALLGGPATFIVIIYFSLNNSIRFKRLINFLVIYSFAYGIILAPWFIRNFFASGDPLWPMGFNFFNTQFYNEITALKYSNWSRGPENSILNYFLTPWYLTTNISMFTAGYGAISFLLVNPMFLGFITSNLVFWVKNSKYQKKIFLFFFIFFLVAYTIWFFGGYTNPRYIQIIYPGLSIITASCVKIIFNLKNTFVKYISMLFIGISLSAMLALSFVINIKYLPVFFGSISKHQYLNNMLPHYSSIDWMNNNLPDTSKVLYVGYSAWFYLDRDYMPMANRSIDYHNISSPSQFKEILDKNNITHIYIEEYPGDEGSTLDKIKKDKFSSKELNLNSIIDCQKWLDVDPSSLGIEIISYYHFRPFILMRGLELTNELELLKTIKSKVVKSRTRGTFINVEDAVYVLK